MLKSPLDRLEAASPMVSKKSAQNATPSFFKSKQSDIEEKFPASFALNKIENAPSTSEQFYLAYDNDELRDELAQAMTYTQENWDFALATRNYVRAREQGNKAGVNRAVTKLQDVLGDLNLNVNAQTALRNAFKDKDYGTLDQILPPSLDRVLAKSTQQQGLSFVSFGKFLNDNQLSVKAYQTRGTEIEDILGQFGS